MAAVTARRSQTFIGAKHRSRLARLDKPVAVNATARELACLIYNMVTRGVNDGGEVHIFAEVCWSAPTRCMTEHLASRRVKPLRGSFAALRPFG